MKTETDLFSRKDFFVAGLLTAAYAVVALIDLGSLKAPQTWWKPSTKGESFYADLGQSQEIERVSYFLSMGEGSYKIDFSADGKTWRDEKIIEQKNVYEMVEWRYFKPGHAVRYVRMTCEKPGAMLNEVGLFGAGKTLIPVRVIVESNSAPGTFRAIKVAFTQSEYGRPDSVFDEQGTVAYVPSFYNSMYFDEIYHSRTAYEYLHHIHPTEPTHPPLGKVLISVGAAVCGMTPFGWRIMGTLFGIAMIPAIYCFAKRLFKRTDAAFIASFLFACDFMHFTYTRIGVIDVFAVFFIIMMYYYMYRYFEMNFYSDRLGRTFVPLLMSGIFFGLGAATKWLAIFGGAALAAILFTSLGQRFYEYVKARKALKAANADPKEIAQSFWGKAILTLLWCVLAFIVIPAGIYLMSYIPFMETPGPGHGVSDVVRLQKYIYDYHRGMQITHPFSSSWWEWPIIRKPLWLYMGKDVPAGSISSIAVMGNPAIWWAGIPAIIAAIFLAAWRKEKAMYVVLLAAASQYLPWAMEPTKLTFIFHFFATVPFMILCIAYVLGVLRDRFGWFKYVTGAYLAAALILFAMFYPILSGMVVSRAYAAEYLRWFSSWIFFV